MKISSTETNGRKGWTLDNEAMTLTLTQGGGHIAGLQLKEGPRVNPFWAPIWKPVEPWAYRPAHNKKYAAKLLAAICGHNLCLGAFGEPSPEEVRAGLGGHGEAPVARWKVIRKKVSGSSLTFVFGCELPLVEMSFQRTITMKRGSSVIRVRESIRNLARRDVPFTMCEHVTFGPPFLERNVTVFDMNATRGHTFPGTFGDIQRLKANADFVWPDGPGSRSKTVDMRTIGTNPKRSSDFSTQLMDPKSEHAWFSAMNPRQGLLIAYVWKRSDFPWIGNWEENGARKSAPWNGRSLTRGMEFSNAPYPIGLRKSVTMGRLFGVPTYDWLPARSVKTMDYSIIARRVNPKCKGVASIKPLDTRFEMELFF